jgi:hypothetical protein
MGMGNSGAKSFDGPEILGLLVAKNVAFAGGEKHAEEGEAGGISAVFDESDRCGLTVEDYADGPFVGLEAVVAFDAKRHALSHRSGL